MTVKLEGAGKYKVEVESVEAEGAITQCDLFATCWLYIIKAFVELKALTFETLTLLKPLIFKNLNPTCGVFQCDGMSLGDQSWLCFVCRRKSLVSCITVISVEKLCFFIGSPSCFNVPPAQSQFLQKQGLHKSSEAAPAPLRAGILMFLQGKLRVFRNWRGVKSC